MKRLTIIGLAVVMIIAIALVFTLGSGVAKAEGANVIKEFGCGLSAHNVPGLGTLVTFEKTHSVVTPNGNTTLTCHFDIPDGFEPAKTIKNSGFLCNTFAGLTTNSMSVATPGGKATLTCQINGSN